MRIFVSDVNDNAPAFPRSVYEVSIDEDRDVGSPVVTATADDKDEGEWTVHVFLSPFSVNVCLCVGWGYLFHGQTAICIQETIPNFKHICKSEERSSGCM